MKSHIHYSAITCDGVTDLLDNVSRNSNDKSATYKIDYYIFHTF